MDVGVAGAGQADQGGPGGQDDQGDRALDRRVVTLWRLWGGGYVAAIVAGVLVTELVAEGLGRELPWFQGAATLAVAIAGAVLTTLVPEAEWRRWRYRISDDALELRHGLVIHTASAIPWFRIQHIDVQAGVVERRLGLARLVVHTASSATDATIPGLPAAEADLLRRLILRRVGVDDGV